MSRHIDADALKKAIEVAPYNDIDDLTRTEQLIDDAPTVSEWIPIKTRSLTNEERVEFAEYYGIEYCDTANELMFDCHLPEDGQEILITTKYGVETDICCIEDCIGSINAYSLEGRGDWEGVIAWMPMPEPYRGDA